jgi:hypothetical protein
MGTHYAHVSLRDCQLSCQSETEFSQLQSFAENLSTTANRVILHKSNFDSILACFVGAVAAVPTKHARTGTFVHMLGDFSKNSHA